MTKSLLKAPKPQNNYGNTVLSAGHFQKGSMDRAIGILEAEMDSAKFEYKNNSKFKDEYSQIVLECKLAIKVIKQHSK